MPVKLVDLKRDRRTIEVHIVVSQDELGNDVTEPLSVTYRPSAYTPNSELELNAKFASDWKSEGGIEFLIMLVITWDLEGEDGQPYPVTKGAIAELPSPFITTVIGGIAEDMGKDKARSNGS